MTNLNQEMKVLEEAFVALAYRLPELYFRVFPKRREEISHQGIYKATEDLLRERKVTTTVDTLETFFEEAVKKYSQEKSDFRFELQSYMGHFSSALSNSISRGTEFVKLKTGDFGNQMLGLGCFLNSNVEVKGDAGDLTGMCMKSGTLKIDGNVGKKLGTFMENGNIEVLDNAGNSVGENMFNGLIEIHGDAGDLVGYNMKNGKINVHGKGGYSVGLFMRDGRINLEGGCESVLLRGGGKIYLKGKPVRTRLEPLTFEDFVKQQKKDNKPNLNNK